MADVEELSYLQKAAIVITSIGAENAAGVYKRLSDDEVERLTLEVSSLPYMDINAVDEVLNEFYELCLTQKVITEGGIDYARSVLEKAYGPEMAQRLMDKVSKSMQTKAFEFVRKSDYKNLLAIIQNEHPQTIALVLSYVNSDQASLVLQELPMAAPGRPSFPTRSKAAASNPGVSAPASKRRSAAAGKPRNAASAWSVSSGARPRDFKTATSTATPSPMTTAGTLLWQKPTHTLTTGPRRSSGTSGYCCSVTLGLENPSRPGASQTPSLTGTYLYS